MSLIIDCKDPNDTMVDDNGVVYTIDDFRPDDDMELEEGQCVCGAFDCEVSYSCHTSGY